MNYIFHKGDYLKEFLKINNLKEEDLEASSFVDFKDLEPIKEFKKKIDESKDCHFLIIGDYDCDGICATTIIKKLFDHLNIKCNYYIPSRSKDGYGLNERMVRMAKDNNFDAIFTVDNGVACKKEIELANSLGLKVFVLDHHEYKEKVDAYAFLHPDLLKEPYRNMSAGGLSSLLSNYYYEDSLSKVLGGLSTLSDMVGVLNYNRFLLKQMLSILKSEDIYQINLLNGEEISYDSLSFNVIPKINAISRMDNNPNYLVKYLLSDKKTCNASVKAINDINELRKKETEKELLAVYDGIQEGEKFVLVSSPLIKEGLCGLIANRLLNKYNKAILVFSYSEGIYKGSCRSREDINLYDLLSKKKELYETFGGHGQALGLSIKEENFNDFIEFLENSEIESTEIYRDVIDMKVEDVDMKLFNLIESLKPFGTDLKEPLIRISNVSYTSKTLMANKYPKFVLTNNLSAISFNVSFNKRIFNDMIGSLKKDKYRKASLSFLIEDLI